MFRNVLYSALAASILVISAAQAAILPENSSSSLRGKKYSLEAEYSGSTFFDHFTTYTGSDPTQGFVNYTDMVFAADQNLVGFLQDSAINATHAYIGVDHSNIAPNGRNSVRLLSKQTFNAGTMTVLDIRHIPVQYGLWPAVWLLGAQGNWPQSGESDIMEWVHETPYNAMTLHTAPECTVDNSTTFQGVLQNTNCNAKNGDTGCSIDASKGDRGNSTNLPTAGRGFNDMGGAVYVHDWTAQGITVWMFPHNALPSDLRTGIPKPWTWTQKPLAKFAGSGCDFAKSFVDMQLIINIDFCGSWAGLVWQSSGAAQDTKVGTCDEYVANNPRVFKDAYFQIASIKIFSAGS